MTAKSNTRYVITGLFVIVGIALLGLLIIWFEGVASVIRGGYEVRAALENSYGIREGKRVHRDGMEVGEVLAVRSRLPEELGVWLVMRINADETIPARAKFIIQQSTVGDRFLDFRTQELPVRDTLPTDGSAVIPMEDVHVRAPSILPDELMESLREGMNQLGGLQDVVESLRELLEPRDLAAVKKGRKPANLSSMIEQFSLAAAVIQKRADDPRTVKLMESSREAADELKTTLTRARKTMDEIDKTVAVYRKTGEQAGEALEGVKSTAETYRELGDEAKRAAAAFAHDAEKAEKLIDELTAIATAVREGEGTVGKLITDDELHRILVTLAENLNQTADDVQRLVTMWREEGILSKQED